MVDVAVIGGLLVVRLTGFDQVWSFRRELKVPLTHVKSVRRDPKTARGLWLGLRVFGTHVPGVLTAGRFYRQGRWRFFCVHDPKKAIVIELEHEAFHELVLEVPDPDAVIRLIEDRVESGIAATPGRDVYEEGPPAG